ncbi:MAG: hypothetical protein JST00_36135 [Deltaproteobacteria bacterium]|nr:hypothetical protein [Deltaproteobacteria bacterium]
MVSRAPDASLAAPGSPARAHKDAAVQAFTTLGKGPRPTFALVLISVTVAVVAMHVDMVAKYSLAGFWVGIAATVALAIGVGTAVSAVATPRARVLAALGLPTAGGAVVGMLVQAVVLVTLSEPDHAMAVKDLGGLVDSNTPALWIAAGSILGAVPALVVSVFLVLAARALRRLVGNDASESFGVEFVGLPGVLAAFAMIVVEPWEMPPLFVVVLLSGFSVFLTFLIDGARLGFLRRVFGGSESSDAPYEVVPAEHFMNDPSLAPMVAQASAVSVLVRVQRNIGSYRAAAREPIALLAATEGETTLPIRRRRMAAAALLCAMTVLGGLSLSKLDGVGGRSSDLHAQTDPDGR